MSSIITNSMAVPEEHSLLIVEGWINVWEVDKDAETSMFADGRTPVPIWEPHLCVLNVETKRLSHFRTEKAALDNRIGNYTVLKIGCKEEFDKHHGIRPVEQDMEIMLMNVSMPLNSSIQTPDGRGSTIGRQQQPPSGNRERRNSISSECSQDEAIKTVSSHSRLANFFARKSQIFRPNLKRAKSGTKLDNTMKKVAGDQQSVETGGSGDNTIVSTITAERDDDIVLTTSSPLKRTLSLGRLSRRWRQSGRKGSKAKDDDISNRLASQVRTSQSHESLLPSPPSGLHSIDLSSPGVTVRPLHSSILSQPHCFQVSTSKGSKYYCCRTDEDQQLWLTYFRRCMHPQRFMQHRTDYSLTVCISEAKNLPQKKRYFCEVCCDKVRYATASSKSDVLLWNELFEFTNLPSISALTINVYREADKKKRKDRPSLVGYVTINVNDISTHQLEERWHPISSAVVGRSNHRENRIDSASMRVKARYQSIRILPVQLYEPLAQWLKGQYSILVEVLEPVVDVKVKEKIASVLVAVFHKMNLAEQFLTDVLVAEISKLDNDTLALRGNSIATKAVESYMKLVGRKYLHETLSSTMKILLDPNVDCEVDPCKVQSTETLAVNQKSLVEYSEKIWKKILDTHKSFPSELKTIFCSLRHRCHSQRSQTVCDQLVSSCVFLRFLCPAILSPNLFGFTQELPSQKAARNVTLVAKTIQSLANFARFGVKEPWMDFMNEFVSRELNNMHTFLQNISDSDADGGGMQRKYEGYIDHGKELALLHSLLVESLSNANINEAAKQKLEPLPAILSQVTSALDNPVPVEVGSPVHRSSFRMQLKNNTMQTKVLPASAFSDSAPCRSSDDQRFTSKKQLNLSPQLIGSAPVERSSISPLTSKHAPVESATIPAAASRHRQQAYDTVGSLKASPKPQRYQSTDVFMMTTPDLLATPDILSSSVSSVATLSSRKSDEKQINQHWQQLVDVASSNRIDLVPFGDDVSDDGSISASRAEVTQTTPTTPRGTTPSLRNPTTLVFTVQLSPPTSIKSVEAIDGTVINGNASLPPKPLSFANPVYGGGRVVVTPLSDHGNHGISKELVGCGTVASYVGCQTVPRGSAKKSNADRSTRNTPPKSVPPKPTTLQVSRVGTLRGQQGGSSESLDSVLVPRPVPKPRSNVVQAVCSPRLAHSASRIEGDSPLSLPQMQRDWGTAPRHGSADWNGESRERDFGALKRLWQSIELPSMTDPSSLTRSSKPKMADTSFKGTQMSSRVSQSASCDAALSDLGNSDPVNRHYSRESLLSCPDHLSNARVAPNQTCTMPKVQKDQTHTTPKTQKDRSELVNAQFDTVCQTVANTQALIIDAENRLRLRSQDGDEVDMPSVENVAPPNRSPPGVEPTGRWVVWL